ncbi:MAG: 6-carboxytetrahydropterin synthase QueD [Clostridia bacterium]|jgi:6-pyruvoyltetrahydropterin/6-carboxytetrahydropterin synthase|nr:6-carboxytetrahydropterin synthase QueD [Clostridia bacterium]
MYILKTKQSFDAAHFLFGYVGKCRNIHGHRWTIEAEIYSETVQEKGEKRGMVVDFGDLKKDLKEIADFFDHSLIIEKNSLKPSTLTALKDENFKITELDFRPTAENLAYFIFKKMEEKGYSVKRTIVYETPDNCAVFEK